MTNSKKIQVPPPLAPKKVTKKGLKNRAFLVLDFEESSEYLPYLEYMTGNKGFKVTPRIVIIS